MLKPVFSSAGPRTSTQLKPRIGAILLVAVVGLVSWSLRGAREAARQDAEQHTGNIALTFRHEIDRVMTTLDVSLKAAMRGLDTPGISGMSPIVQKATLFDRALAAEGLGGATNNSVARREFFQHHRDRDDSEFLVTCPFKGGTDGQWTVVLSRRINDADGTFGGVAFAGLHATSTVLSEGPNN